jgi:hypothetical protein
MKESEPPRSEESWRAFEMEMTDEIPREDLRPMSDSETEAESSARRETDNSVEIPSTTDASGSSELVEISDSA